MAKYLVEHRACCIYEIPVEADSEEEALEKADELFNGSGDKYETMFDMLHTEIRAIEHPCAALGDRETG
jgi:hypothetical protein